MCNSEWRKCEKYMNRKHRNFRWLGLALLFGVFGLSGCAQALQTASDSFDSLVGDLLSAGQDSYSENGNVSVRILTPTPTPDATLVPTPSLTPTPTPRPADMEPDGEKVDEQVYAVSAVNIRAGWSADFKIVGSLQANDQIHRIAVLDNGWSKVCYNNEYAYVNSAYLTTERPGVVGTVHLDTTDYMYKALKNGEDVVMLGVQNILQKPDLPAGPEITCLAIVLNYLGEYVDKVFLAENYLTVAEPGAASPYQAYLGDPKMEEGSYGCYAPVIMGAANRYFSEKGIYRKTALDVSGSTMEELLAFVQKGTPVIVWGTTNLVPSKVTTEWEIDGELFQWKDYEHCTVLMGYNKDRSTVIVADPLRGIVEFDMDKYYKRYMEQYCNAVIISGQ
ncbi:MAG: C39 family peptidase [Lachnospiraceae bacterium]|nr:C39 family peptidase [Lachnospiraceae bacterium]